MRLRSVRRRSDWKRDSVERNWSWPVERESCVRKTAVVRCIVSCIEARRVDVGVEPEELSIVSISRMEERPMSDGAAWWGVAGAWCEEMWWADARPWKELVRMRAGRWSG